MYSKRNSQSVSEKTVRQQTDARWAIGGYDGMVEHDTRTHRHIQAYTGIYEYTHFIVSFCTNRSHGIAPSLTLYILFLSFLASPFFSPPPPSNLSFSTPPSLSIQTASRTSSTSYILHPYTLHPHTLHPTPYTLQNHLCTGEHRYMLIDAFPEPRDKDRGIGGQRVW